MVMMMLVAAPYGRPQDGVRPELLVLSAAVSTCEAPQRKGSAILARVSYVGCAVLCCAVDLITSS